MRERYHHESLGYNFRMTDINAAIGLAQLHKLPALTARRREIAARYDAELRGVTIPRVREGVTHVYHQYTLRVPQRDQFAARLAERGVGSGIYYPIPVHRQAAFAPLGYGTQSYPVSELLADEVLSIPVHASLTNDEVATVIGAVNAVAVELGELGQQVPA
jgi:dTDP-4-amino-4,6-dideoxygalactose transaminase